MKAATRKFRVGKKRIAVHEAGHLIMALILGLDVRGCSILSAGQEWRPGELGRCTVLVPDPIGLRRFLVSMGGVMAEDHFYGEEHGGARDRHDALHALQNFLAHYQERGSENEVENLFRDVASLFHRKDILKVLERSAGSLQQNHVLENREISEIAALFPNQGELAEIRERLARLETPSPAPAWRETLLNALKTSRGFLLRFRKPFDDNP